LDDNGSPPRAWGQWRDGGDQWVEGRFTPTGVGTMPRAFLTHLWVSVHPHGRGDNVNQWFQQGLGERFTPTGVGTMTRSTARLPATAGSPPRAWGQYALRCARRHTRRFTPTGVGTICARSRSSERSTVHPHGRGDNRSL